MTGNNTVFTPLRRNKSDCSLRLIDFLMREIGAVVSNSDKPKRGFNRVNRFSLTMSTMNSTRTNSISSSAGSTCNSEQHGGSSWTIPTNSPNYKKLCDDSESLREQLLRVNVEDRHFIICKLFSDRIDAHIVQELHSKIYSKVGYHILAEFSY